MKAVRVQQWKPDTRCVILSSAELQMVENVRVRNQSGRFHKTKTKKQQKGVRFPLSRWNYTCFSSQLCFCLHAASFYFKYVTHRRLNASEKSSNYSVRVWKSPFECRSPALCGFTRGHFSVFWLISHLKHRDYADTSRPRHLHATYLLRGCLKWRSFLKPVFWWAEYKDVLWNFFFTVLQESRGSNMKENVEEFSWYLIVRVNEATSGFLHLRGSVFLHNSPFFSRCGFLKTHVMMSLDSDLT